MFFIQSLVGGKLWHQVKVICNLFLGSCDKLVGGLYDDRLLVKPTKSAIAYMSDPAYEVPYEGAKEMLLVEEVDNKAFLTGLFHAMYDELPMPKSKKKK